MSFQLEKKKPNSIKIRSLEQENILKISMIQQNRMRLLKQGPRLI